MWDLLHFPLLIIPLVLALFHNLLSMSLEQSGSIRIGIIPSEAFTTDLNILRDMLFLLTQIIIFILIIIFLISLIMWMCKNEGEGLRIRPFDNTTDSSKYDGKAISDSLIAELQNILQIYQFDHEYVRLDAGTRNPHDLLGGALTSTTVNKNPANSSFPWLRSSRDNLDIGISDIGSINVAGTSLPLGQLLINLKGLWPIKFGKQNCVICGSLQKYGSLFRLVASVEKSDLVSVWEVSCKITYDYQIPTLIRDLAFKIAKDLWSNIPAAKSARTWEGFKHYTIALNKYNKYIYTYQIENLERARVHCIEALKTEKDYEPLFDLFNILGSTYFNISEYNKSEDMFRFALESKSGSKVTDYEEI